VLDRKDDNLFAFSFVGNPVGRALDEIKGLSNNKAVVSNNKALADERDRNDKHQN
jgi:hypothetical protein